MNVEHYARLVVRPTLIAVDLWSTAAERLVVGSAVHEMAGLEYIRQGATTLAAGDGVARGPGLEPATVTDVYVNFLSYRGDLRRKVDAFLAPRPSREEQCATNLAYGALMVRLVYYRQREPLPRGDDLAGLASYWKRYFNTAAGAGTPAKWLADWDRYAAPVYGLRSSGVASA